MKFGPFEVDFVTGELRKHGTRLRLQEQPLQALALLLERPGQLVTREELQKKLWPDGTFVDFERGLNKAINRLRVVLGDDAGQPRYIETLPQRGYRFIGTLEEVAQPVPAHATGPAASAPAEPARPDRRMWIAAIAAVPAAGFLVYRAWRPAGGAGAAIQSIAVLPLENLSQDREQEYFADGMTDTLIGELARAPGLRVISRTSVMRYKGATRKPLPVIARELNVDAIVEGTVLRAGDKVRITAQLIRASDDRHLMAERYERDLSDILDLQASLARDIASHVRANLMARSQARKVNPEAYQEYLRANFFLYQGIRGTGQSMDGFRRAIALDPGFADSHSGLAEALAYAGIFGLRPSAGAYQEARREALTALQIDPANAAAHNALADVLKGYDWNLSAAEAEYRKALELNSSHLLTHLWYAELLMRRSRAEEALAQSSRAVALDPVSSIAYNNRSMLLWRARRYDDAIRAGNQALELEPSRVNAFWWIGLAHAGKKDFGRAIETLQKGLAIAGGAPLLSAAGNVYGQAGERAKALAVIEELKALAVKRWVSPIDFAVVHAGLGDAEAAFSWLEKAFQMRETRIHELPHPVFDSIRSDPRHAHLLRRTGLPPV